jgi:hypothetical protein
LHRRWLLSAGDAARTQHSSRPCDA